MANMFFYTFFLSIVISSHVVTCGPMTSTASPTVTEAPVAVMNRSECISSYGRIMYYIMEDQCHQCRNYYNDEYGSIVRQCISNCFENDVYVDCIEQIYMPVLQGSDNRDVTTRASSSFPSRRKRSPGQAGVADQFPSSMLKKL